MNLHFEELTGTDGARIGIASLDAEKSLNALSLPMINALRDQLDAWAKDPQIVCVLLRGNGAKAFCAGGEVRSLVEACRAHPGEVPPLAAHFFAAEYRLDYQPAHLPETADLLGPRLRAGRRHGPAARGEHPHCHAEQPIGDAGDQHRSVPGRRRQLVPVAPARQARVVPRPDRCPHERSRCDRSGPGRPFPAR